MKKKEQILYIGAKKYMKFSFINQIIYKYGKLLSIPSWSRQFVLPSQSVPSQHITTTSTHQTILSHNTQYTSNTHWKRQHMSFLSQTTTLYLIHNFMTRIVMHFKTCYKIWNTTNLGSNYKSNIQARASPGWRWMFRKVTNPVCPWEEAKTEPPK